MGLANPDLAGTKVGEEFATSSVSSPGLENYLVTLSPAQIKGIFEGVVDDLNWMDASQRGFLKMSFTPSEAKGEWFFVNTISDRTYNSSLGHKKPWSADCPIVKRHRFKTPLGVSCAFVHPFHLMDMNKCMLASGQIGPSDLNRNELANMGPQGSGEGHTTLRFQQNGALPSLCALGLPLAPAN
jgi:hypothetical protein